MGGKQEPARTVSFARPEAQCLSLHGAAEEVVHYWVPLGPDDRNRDASKAKIDPARNSDKPSPLHPHPKQSEVNERYLNC